jgi:hypothetical protein
LILSVAILAYLLSSCTRKAIHIDHDIELSKTQRMPLHTPYADVLARLGPPAKVTALPDGFAFLYEQSTVFQYGFSWFFIYPVLGLGITKGKRVVDTYAVVFDAHGVVVGDGHTTGAVPLSFEVSMSAFTSSEQLRELTAPAPVHRWGVSLLKPLPKTLNSGSDMDAGEHGLEQEATPKGVGQRTLERVYGPPRRSR